MFSAIVPVYNHAEYLGSAVESALRSRWVQEVLLVDDGSHDGSADLAAELARRAPERVRDLTEAGGANHGAAQRLNQLVSEARADWIAVLNSDDAFVPGRFDVLRTLIRGRRGDFFCGQLLIMNEEGRLIGTKRGVLEPEYPFPADFAPHERSLRGEVTELLGNQNFIATTSNMVFHRDLHGRVGGFKDLRYSHDWDFALRASLQGTAVYVPHFLTIYRAHARNTIKEDQDRNTLEVRRLFDEFVADFPELRERPGFALAMRGNHYLA